MKFKIVRVSFQAASHNFIFMSYEVALIGRDFVEQIANLFHYSSKTLPAISHKLLDKAHC